MRRPSAGTLARRPPQPAAAEPPAEPAAPLAREYETVLTRERLDAWLQRLRDAPIAALDTETDSLDPMRARIVGISFAVKPGEAAYVPLAHNYPGAPEQLPLDAVLAALKPWLEDAARAEGRAATSSTTATCSPTTASRCAASRTTRCCRATCSRRTAARPRKPGRAPPGPQGPDLRRRVRQGRQPDRVLAGRHRSAPPNTRGEDSEMTLQLHQTLLPAAAARAGAAARLRAHRDAGQRGAGARSSATAC